MNLEDPIVYDMLTKQIRSSDRVIRTINLEKEINSDEYIEVAALCPKITGSIGLDIYFQADGGNNSNNFLWIGIFNASGTLVTENYVVAGADKVSIYLPLGLANAYKIKGRSASKNGLYTPKFTITKIDARCEIYDTGKLLVSLTEA